MLAATRSEGVWKVEAVKWALLVRSPLPFTAIRISLVGESARIFFFSFHFVFGGGLNG